ncbi:diguanylate cyclase [Parabacteroides sp. An277]|uniref:dihydroorotate dehydrogenase-like protein n=1 Tax=Parabacteroides sp. An277 TaxID=1965619 RepID=UPI000B399352|nr:dihydroorotate dehydrogenase-like protein [Parabacteroides sp. An277]OUO53335.1 diguanylate cyclase [Parabacteroides sp. An277]
MANLKTQYAGLTLQSPIIVSSSGLTMHPERNKEFEKAGAGAIVLKSLFEEQIEMQGDTMLQESGYPEAADYIRGYVKANQVENYLNLIRQTKALCTVPIIASINCYRADTWIEFAKHLEEAGADALELNVFELDTDIHSKGGEMQKLYVNILKQVKKEISIPVTVKLGKYTSNLPALVNQLHANGADGVVLFNRFYRPDIDINTLQIVSGNVFSNHGDLSDTLRWTAIVSGKLPNVSISASTGVHDWEDVIKCLLAGASAVQMCSALYTHGAELISQILTCIDEWMHQENFNAISDFIGRLNYANIPNPTLYERSQFMKYFSNRD